MPTRDFASLIHIDDTTTLEHHTTLERHGRAVAQIVTTAWADREIEDGIDKPTPRDAFATAAFVTVKRGN